MPDERYDTAAVRVADHLYIIGGADNSLSRPLDSVYYSTVHASGLLGNWHVTTPLPTVRQAASAVASNGYIYVVGGGDSAHSVLRAT